MKMGFSDEPADLCRSRICEQETQDKARGVSGKAGQADSVAKAGESPDQGLPERGEWEATLSIVGNAVDSCVASGV